MEDWLDLEDVHWVVYGLVDPRNNAIRYVGRTITMAKRLRQHVIDSKLRKTRVQCWISSLVKLGLTPHYTILESGFSAYVDSGISECNWIAKLKAQGIRLTNSTDGGDGTRGMTRKFLASIGKDREIWVPHAVRLKISATLKGHPGSCPPQSRLAISAILKKKWQDPEFRQSNADGRKRRSILHPPKVYVPKIGLGRLGLIERRLNGDLREAGL